MNNRNYQEEKFRNIVLKFDNARSPRDADLQVSSIVHPTFSPERTRHRPSTPLHARNHPHPDQPHAHPPQDHPHLTSSPSHPSSSQIRAVTIYESVVGEGRSRGQSRGPEWSQLYQQLSDKEAIIAQLKNIIKLSNQNNARSRQKSNYPTEKSPDRQREEAQREEQMRELRDQVKILTIENNKLLDIIEKMRNDDALVPAHPVPQDRDRPDTHSHRSHLSQPNSTRDAIPLKSQISRLQQLLSDKEDHYERKIDEFILSHKSLAAECKRLEHERNHFQAENEALQRALRELEDAHRRNCTREEEKTARPPPPEKLTIVKIKEQYAESLKQFKETVTFQTQHLFDIFRNSLEEISSKVARLEGRLAKCEESLRPKTIHDLQHKFVKSEKRHSEIYIEEGVESMGSDSDVRRSKHYSQTSSYREKPFAVSRVYEENIANTHKHTDEELAKPYQEEIAKLKNIIADLNQQLSEQSQYYTFREREYENSVALSSQRQTEQQLQEVVREKEEKEREMLAEIDALKDQIDQLELVYKEEQINTQEGWYAKLSQKEETITVLDEQLHQERSHNEEYRQEIERLAASHADTQQLEEEVEHLRKEFHSSLTKIEQYGKLCALLKEEMDENHEQTDLFSEMKRQVRTYQQKYQHDQLRLANYDKENKEILLANAELKSKLQQQLSLVHKYYQQIQQLRTANLQREQQIEEISSKFSSAQNIIKHLQKQLQVREEAEQSLNQEKNALEKQLVDYLSIFNKLTLQEVKTQQPTDSPNLEELLSQICRLQASFTDLQTSRREKRAKLTLLLSEQTHEQPQLP